MLTPPLNRKAHEVGIAADVEFVSNADAMHVNGLGTQPQCLGDFLTGPTLAKEFEDLELAVSELAQVLAIIAGRREECCENSLKEVFTGVHFSFLNGSNGVDQRL